jgi:DNA-binding Xre family transcriptional regulator
MWMRLRLPELLSERRTTAYAVAKASDKRISMSTLYRLTKSAGRVAAFDASLCEALCDVLGVTPGELFETDAEEAARVAAERPARKKAK